MMFEKPGYRKKISKNMQATIAAIFVFVFKCVFNLAVPIMRSLPDEIGAMALAASWVGYDWSYVLTHPEMYYGSGTALFIYPIFYFVKEPMIRYQCLLGIGAFLHAVVAFIVCRILLDFYHEDFKGYESVLIGIIGAIFIPTRTSNFDNEPMMVFICWIIIYLIILLQNTDCGKRKKIYSMFLAFVLSVSYLSHTRAIIYIIVMFFVIIIYYYMTKQMLVNLYFFCATFISSFIAISSLVSKIRTSIFSQQEVDNSIVSNSPQSLVNSISNGLDKFFSVDGVRGALDLFLSNLWVVFVFTGGLFCIAVLFLFNYAKKIILRRIRENILVDRNDIFFPFIYCMLGFFITLVGLCITWIDGGIAVYTAQNNLTRGHFYLRYYGNFITPIIVFSLVYLLNNKCIMAKKYINRLLLIVFMIVDYCLLSFISVALKGYEKNLDWFYYFAPFSCTFKKWPEVLQSLNYFIVATLVVFVCASFFIYLLKKNKVYCLVFFLLVGVWEYGYGVLAWDRPFALSDNYYLSVDSSYKLWKKDPSIFAGCDTLYYINERFGPAYILQFIFYDKMVITDITLVDIECDEIILTNELTKELGEIYSYVKLDDNEYLYVNSTDRKKKLENLGFEIISPK